MTVPRGSFKFLILVLISAFLLSCESVSYYSQAASGQLSIMLARQDIEQLLEDSSIADPTREKLSLVLEIRDYAERQMQLPVASNYTTYVDVEREHVVWNVFAAPEFSTEALNWCYPIAGCVSYRGYFSERSAQRYAEKIEKQGYDVYTGGVDAYSTLGWFDDSLLSTVINRDDYQLAGLIFHELAHQIIYLPGDTTFNESFATAVEREGIRRWLDARGQTALISSAELSMQRQEEFVGMVSGWRDRFDQLYAEEIAATDMRAQKHALQQEMRAEYQRMKVKWGGYGGYDSWFARSLNNAQLSTVSSYNDLVPAFNALLSQHEGELAAFYTAVADLAELPQEQRELALDELLEP